VCNFDGEQNKDIWVPAFKERQFIQFKLAFFKILRDIDYIAHTKSKVAAIQIYSFISSENMF
jgi:hypothetical protein